MEIRTANIEDLENIQKLNLRLFEKEVVDYDPTLAIDWTFSNTGREYFSRKISSAESFAVVAEKEGEIVGYLVGGEKMTYPFRKIDKMAEIENMLIEDKYRGQGVGSKLVKAFSSWCQERGIQRMRATAYAGNLRAINFYRKHGFKDYELTLEAELECEKVEK